MPAFRFINDLFVLNFFRSLVGHFRILRSSFIGIYAPPLSSSLLVLLTLMSAKPVKISDRGVFYGVYVLASVIYGGKS